MDCLDQGGHSCSPCLPSCLSQTSNGNASEPTERFTPQSQYKNVLLEPTGGQGVVLIDLIVRLPISLHSFYEHLSMSATVEATTPTSLSTLANIVPTDGVQAQIAESATGGLDLALNDQAMATKLKVGLAIIPGE